MAMVVLGLGALPGNAIAALRITAQAGTLGHASAAAMPDRAGDKDRPRQQHIKKRRIAAPRVISAPAAAKPAHPSTHSIPVALTREPDAIRTAGNLPGVTSGTWPILPPSRRSPPGHAPPRA